MRPTPWKIRGWSGEHDGSGALIEDAEGKYIATTYGGMRQASSAQEWTDYRETAEFIAGAPANIAALRTVAAALAEALEVLLMACTYTEGGSAHQQARTALARWRKASERGDSDATDADA